MESQLIPKMGVKYYGISTGKFRRYHKSTLLNIIDPTTIYKNIKDFFGFLGGIKEARKILKYERPDVIFAKGGYVSLPVGYAARFLRIPIVVHESDTIMGMANRIMAKFAQKVAVSFPAELFPDIDSEKIIQTGNPVREDLVVGDREAALRRLGLKKDKKTLLIIGGSQGSLFINENILDIADDLLTDIQIIWIAGERDSEFINYRLADLPKEKKERLKLFGFVTNEMSDLYNASDLVVSRPGSNVLYELTMLGKPAILIPPSENIAGGHQFENARFFSRNGASLTIKQVDLTPKKLYGHIIRLINDKEELNYMTEKMKKLAQPNASENLAEIIYEVGEEEIEQTRKTKAE